MTFTFKDIADLNSVKAQYSDLMLSMPLIGSIYWVDLDMEKRIGKEQKGIRPCIIMNCHIYDGDIPCISAIPLTTKLKALNLPTHALIEPTHRNGLTRKSMVLAEQMTTIDLTMLKNPIGILKENDFIKALISLYNSCGVENYQKTLGNFKEHFEQVDILYEQQLMPEVSCDRYLG